MSQEHRAQLAKAFSDHLGSIVERTLEQYREQERQPRYADPNLRACFRRAALGLTSMLPACFLGQSS